MTKNALNSLYGEGHAQATLNKTWARECVPMPGVRNQVILTPQCIVDGLLKFWPEGILYDATCDEEEHLLCEDGTSTKGLIDPWPDRTYCNPPYGTSLFDPLNQMEDYLHECEIREAHREVSVRRKKEGLKPHALSFSEYEGLPVKPKAGLKDWLKMQLTHSEGESIMLVPNRTHRKWLRDWRRQVTALVELDPLTFHGFPQSFPAPLVLGLVTQGTVERTLDFHKAFAHVGDPA